MPRHSGRASWAMSVGPRREEQAGRHLPARRLHPDQGAAACRRGRGRDPRVREVRRHVHLRRRGHRRRSRPTAKRSSRRKYKGLQGLIKARGITVVRGRGRLASPTSVQVGDTTLVGKNVVARAPARTRARFPGSRSAAGSSPRAGARARLRAQEGGRARRRRDRRRVLASVWRSLGAEVTIVEALPTCVPNEDEAITQAVRARVPQARASSSRSASGSGRSTQNEQQASSSPSRTATTVDGRAPAGRGRPRSGDRTASGYAEAGVTMDRGFVITNERLPDQRVHASARWATSSPACNSRTAGSSRASSSPRSSPGLNPDRRSRTSTSRR